MNRDPRRRTGRPTTEVWAVKRRNTALEVVAACLLGLATVGSAWCAFQASQWNERSTEHARTAQIALVEGNRLHSLAATTIAYDTNVITSYAEAVATGETKLAALHRTTLMRPGFLPILDRWEAEVGRGESPTNLLDDGEYLDDLFGPYRLADQRAGEASAASVTAGRNAVEHLATTVLFAMALFFAGITTSFRSMAVKMATATAAGMIVAVAAARIADLPIA